MNSASTRTFFGHPAGLSTLFFAELWERFSYYGMRAILVLAMVDAVVNNRGGLNLDDATATAIYGIYTAAVYLFALPGGWIADRLIGQQRAIWYGGIIIMLGHFTMAIPTPQAFFLGLVLIVVGTGLLKPNISAIVGGLYPQGGAERDAGFSVFYMGINIGAFAGPLICGWLGETYNWHLGFGAAGVGMLLGLIYYRYSQGFLGEVGKYPAADHDPKAVSNDPLMAEREPMPESHIDPMPNASRKNEWIMMWIGVGVLVAMVVAVMTGLVAIDPITFAKGTGGFIVALAFAYFLYLILFGGLTSQEKKRVGVIAAFFVGAAMFWSGFEQAGSSLNLFAERYTDRVIFGWEVPASWLQSVNPLFIIVLAPVFGWFWVWLAKRNLEPSMPAKFALGLIQLGLGFGVMIFAAIIVVESGEGVLPTWLIMTYLLHTMGELCLSPIGLSAITKLAPKRYVSQLMGTWFMGAALGNLIGGLVAGYFGDDALEVMPDRFATVTIILIACGLLFAVAIKPLKRWIGDIR
jgi:POT family proton-dependent oligopeptide transporter